MQKQFTARTLRTDDRLQSHLHRIKDTRNKQLHQPRIEVGRQWCGSVQPTIEAFQLRPPRNLKTASKAPRTRSFLEPTAEENVDIESCAVATKTTRPALVCSLYCTLHSLSAYDNIMRNKQQVHMICSSRWVTE